MQTLAWNWQIKPIFKELESGKIVADANRC